MGFWKRLFGGSSITQPDQTPRAHTSRPPTPRAPTPNCASQHCSRSVYKVEHTHCYSCWKELNPPLKKEKKPSPSTMQAYNRLIEMVAIGSGKGMHQLTEDNFNDILCGQHKFVEADVASIIASPIARGILQWDQGLEVPEDQQATLQEDPSNPSNATNLADQWRESIEN